MADKVQQLIKHLAGYKQIAVAFSGGVDSSLLLAAATLARGKARVLAITGESPLRPGREQERARQTAAVLGVELLRLRTREMAMQEFIRNPPERCYLCKRHLLTLALDAARRWQPESVLVEGSNRDDLKEYRPGREAVRELGVVSPLLELGFTKQEIRAAARQLGLASWDRPAFSCLATRIPHSSPITRARLERIERAEAILHELGFDPVRVRDHKDLCRIEIEKEKLPHLLDERVRKIVVERIGQTGYRFITLDLEGMRRGSPAPPSVDEAP